MLDFSRLVNYQAYYLPFSQSKLCLYGHKDIARMLWRWLYGSRSTRWWRTFLNFDPQSPRSLLSLILKCSPYRWVSYPGLTSHPSHEMAKRMLRKGCFGGVLSFGVIGGKVEDGSKVVDSLSMSTNLPNVGDAKTVRRSTLLFMYVY